MIASRKFTIVSIASFFLLISCDENSFNKTGKSLNHLFDVDSSKEISQQSVINLPIYSTERIQKIGKIRFRELQEVVPSKNEPKSDKFSTGFDEKFFYIKDSTILSFNPKSKKVRSIYKASKGSRIVKYVHNWKRGLIVLEQNDSDSRVIKVSKNERLEIDTLYSVYHSDGEGYESIGDINISPTGDFMALSMGYWEGHGLRVLDMRDNSVIEYFPEFGYVTDFVKWLPFNSALLISCDGSEMAGYEDLHVFNMNLETKKFKSWEIPQTIYEGFFEQYGTVTIIGTPAYGNQNILRIASKELRQILDSDETKHNSNVILNGDTIEVSIRPHLKFFECLLTKNNVTLFNKKFELEYPMIKSFVYLSVGIDSTNQSVQVEFQVNYGAVTYHIDLSGSIIKKSYNNVSEERHGFVTWRGEFIIDSLQNIVNVYEDGEFIKTIERKPLNDPISIPLEIEYEK